MPEGNEKGPLTEAVYYLLLALLTPLHGYGIMQFVKDVSHERVNLGPGTLYGAINTLLEKGWIVGAPQEGRKKEYEITSLGKEILKVEVKRLEELLENGKKLLGGLCEDDL